MRPYAPIPRLVEGGDHRSLLQRVLKLDVAANVARIDLITTSFLRVSLIDTGDDPTPQIAEGDTTLHILWQANEPNAWLEIEGERHSIAPGDTACIPSGDAWRLSSHQLAVLIVRRSAELALPVPPHHGEESFTGFNRRTAYSGTTLARWKITQPLSLPGSGTDIVLIGIYADIALQWQAGIDLIPQGGCRVIRAGSGPFTLVPNGLSYSLMLG